MARARVLLRVPVEGGQARVYFEEHTLDGYGETPEAARVDFAHRMCELAEDGLEPTVPLGEPTERPHSQHGGGGVRGYRYGHGLVRIRKRKG